jgi:hypothetical protein
MFTAGVSQGNLNVNQVRMYILPIPTPSRTTPHRRQSR